MKHSKYLTGWIVLALTAPVLFGFTKSEEPSAPIAGFECSEPGNEYYTLELVTTKKVPGTGQAYGKSVMKFAHSPFGISITKDGSYQHKLEIQLERVNKPKNGVLVAWVTTPTLSKFKKIGALDDNFHVTGTVEWNKYIVVITLEESADGSSNMWEGPIAMRGLSKSGRMHTMAGHGPFDQEPCAKYGYE